MKETPILFSEEMDRAIQDGRKTVKIIQKNCAFDQECLFLVRRMDGYKCQHPQYDYSSSFISVLFERCPLKKDSLYICLEEDARTKG